MNIKKLFFLLLTVSFFTSCEKLDEEFTQFEIDYTTSVTIEESTGLNLPFDLLTPETQTNAESKFAVHDTRKDLVEEVRLEELTLTITVPEEQRFDFMNSIQIFINADGLSEIQLAFKDPIPSDVGDVLELDVNNNNLREYVIKDSFTLRLEVVTDQTINEDVDIDIYSRFFVDAKLIQ